MPEKWAPADPVARVCRPWKCSGIKGREAILIPERLRGICWTTIAFSMVVRLIVRI